VKEARMQKLLHRRETPEPEPPPDSDGDEDLVDELDRWG
jgi:hypothetical protein